MDYELNEMQKPFKFIFIIIIIESMICLAFGISYTGNYDKNVFEIIINNKKMSCYYTEKYKNGFITTTSDGYNDVDELVNKIEFSDNIYLSINEYEVYYKNGHRRPDNTGWYINKNDFEYKKVNNDLMIEIKRNNKVLYNGKYINNLNEYINERGRYYFHIYSKRKDNLFIGVNTHISFNVIVGGDNND